MEKLVFMENSDIEYTLERLKLNPLSFFLDIYYAVGQTLGMLKQEKVEYWLDIADYDLQTARSMFTSGRYLYVVFMCQQALEKIIKALYVNTFDAEPPRSHNLTFILSKSGITASPERVNLLTRLSAHYINNRYPEYKSKLSSLLNKTEAEGYLTNTEEVYTWLKSQII